MARKPGPSSGDVDAYFARLTPAQRALLAPLRATIRAAAPEAEELLSYGIPAFRQGRVLVYYAAYRDHCSFFVGSATARARFARELRPFAGGKGTVRFTREHPLPLGLVRRIVRVRVAENAHRDATRRGRPPAGSSRRRRVARKRAPTRGR